MFVVKGETSRSHEIDEKGLHEEFGSSDTSVKLEKLSEHVKSTSPTTETWQRKLCTYSMKYNMSDEDKHDTNYINKHKYTNTDTRKLHL